MINPCTGRFLRILREGILMKTHSFKFISFCVDFSHMAGLHYLKDIDIPKNIVKLRPKIEDGSINDEHLRKSKMYNASSDNVKDVESRIFNIRYIEQFLDSRNLVFNYLSSLNRT